MVNSQGDRVHDTAQTDVQQVPRGLLEIAIGVKLGAKVVGTGAETGIGAVMMKNPSVSNVDRNLIKHPKAEYDSFMAMRIVSKGQVYPFFF